MFASSIKPDFAIAYIPNAFLRLKKTLSVESCVTGPYTLAEASSMKGFLMLKEGGISHPHPPRSWRYPA